ncbi:MAG: M23 family metallopeptidase [bacterium]|nr:M23 family metallopeptidase [bacterium]
MRSITQRNGACLAVAASNPCKTTEPFKARVPPMPITSLQPVFGSTKSVITKAVAFLLLFVSAFLLGGQSQALAAWPIAGHEQISLGYLDRYIGSSAETFVHHGVDIPAEAGAQVRAPVAGEVSFVGSIPADESSGAPTTLGVSIRMDDGRVVTLLPFSDVAVKPGEVVTEGEALGALARSGDRSSPATHLHMGLKRGRIYFNPMELLDGLEPAEQLEPEIAPVAVTPIALPAAAEAAPAATFEVALAIDAPVEAASAETPFETPSISSPIEADALENYRESLVSAGDGAGIFSRASGKILAALDGFLHSAGALLTSIGGVAFAVSLAGTALLVVAIRLLARHTRGESKPAERRMPASQRLDLPLRAARLLGRKRPLAN